jgi:hypothetical protein
MTAPETYLWHIWPARHWPASAEEESSFLADLAAAVNMPDQKIARHERGDLTTVLNALRNGMSYEELLRVAPGVVPQRLLSAYRYIDKLRISSLSAFSELLAHPNQHTVHLHATQAAQLLPVPTYRLVAAVSDPGLNLRKTVAAIKESIVTTMEVAAEHEDRLAHADLPAFDAVRLGRSLYDPFAGGVWSLPHYTPPRVGTLVPARVRDLLGERED